MKIRIFEHEFNQAKENLMSLLDLVDQLEDNVNSGNYFMALQTALTLPDIGGAINSEDGQATGKKYARWYNEWVRPVGWRRDMESMLTSAGIPPEEREKWIVDVYGSPEERSPFNGELCYLVRCSMLHQARSTKDKLGYRVLFIEPDAREGSFHFNSNFQGPEPILTIDVRKFCEECLTGFRDWHASESKSDIVKANLEASIQRRVDGYPPFVVGLPVIT